MVSIVLMWPFLRQGTSVKHDYDSPVLDVLCSEEASTSENSSTALETSFFTAGPVCLFVI